jgi:hypothetical protein
MGLGPQSPDEWLLLSTCIARMGELNPVYRSHLGYARRDLETAIRAGRAMLRGHRPGVADQPPEVFDEQITARHRLDVIYDTLSERKRGPSGDVVVLRQAEIEWTAIKEYLRTEANKSWPIDESRKTPYSPILLNKKVQRRGPSPGTVDRYGDSDKALFQDIKRIMRLERKSVHAAALDLARADKVQGHGTSESRAKRLAKRFRREYDL